MRSVGEHEGSRSAAYAHGYKHAAGAAKGNLRRSAPTQGLIEVHRLVNYDLAISQINDGHWNAADGKLVKRMTGYGKGRC